MKFIRVLLLALFPVVCYSEEAKFPPVFYQTNVQDEAFEVLLKQESNFEMIDSESVGRPIGLLIVEKSRRKQTATAFSSGLISAVALGVLPVLDDREYAISYKLYAQGQEIVEFEYGVTATEFRNFWTIHKTINKAADAENAYRNQTISMFFDDLTKSKEANKLFEEYRYYFK
ncbi:hypothetical protein ACFOEK_10505 [Litoribrevibacter euphylliae]|uniref:DUF4468 domain-containing protein n=1 Tax=Litoribrevibacter euphylliae TaxID=1834034 RepID=A0ABV7HCD8_9GAMM